MGCLMEQMEDFKSAVSYYKEAHSLGSDNPCTWYFINNNLGYSLNRLGNFTEGEKYCRAAIKIDKHKSNGFKNLGISLEGQSRAREAVNAFVSAVQANAADPRPLDHLEFLLDKHPKLKSEFEGKFETCLKAVGFVEKEIEKYAPTVHKGLMKYIILLKARIRGFINKFQEAGLY
jgi:tetratricopeptide (TPR) repeat protein